MMDPSNVASQSASQTSNASNPPLPEAILPTLPLAGAVAPAFNYAIALQQYQFQQSLMNQQLVAQQQAVAHAGSIKAAAERAAARAAEISMLLNGETKVVQRSEDLVAEREKSEKSGPKSRSRSASPPQSSKPNTVSPIRYRNSRREPEEHSPRDRSGYGSRRNSSSYSRSNDLRGYSRSSYRRGEDYSSSRSSYHRSSNTSWSRRRSPLSRSRYRHVGSRSPRRPVGSRSPRRHVGSRSPRRHVGSHSPRRHRIRSPSPMSRQRPSSRISTRHSISKSPIKGGSCSSPRRSRKVSPRTATARRSLSSSDDSPIHNTANLLLKENKASDAINTSENKISSNAKPSRGNLVNGRSNSDHFDEMNSEESALKKSVSRDFASASMVCSDSDSSQGRSVRRGLGSRGCENNSETSVPPRYTDQINLPTEILDRCSNRNDGDTENRNGEFSMSNGKGKKLRESATEKGPEGGHRKHSRISKPLSSLEPEDNLSDHGQRNYSDEHEEKMQVNKEFHMHEQELPWKVISSIKEDSANIPGECAIYPLPEGHESMDVKEVDFSPSIMVPDGDAKADGNVPASPKVSKHREKRHKRRDRSTKHRKSHHKKHRDDEFEEDEEEEDADSKRESHEKRKMKRCEMKGRERYHESHDERQRNRKHQDVPI